MFVGDQVSVETCGVVRKSFLSFRDVSVFWRSCSEPSRSLMFPIEKSVGAFAMAHGNSIGSKSGLHLLPVNTLSAKPAIGLSDFLSVWCVEGLLMPWLRYETATGRSGLR